MKLFERRCCRRQVLDPQFLNTRKMPCWRGNLICIYMFSSPRRESFSESSTRSSTFPVGAHPAELHHGAGRWFLWIEKSICSQPQLKVSFLLLCQPTLWDAQQNVTHIAEKLGNFSLVENSAAKKSVLKSFKYLILLEFINVNLYRKTLTTTTTTSKKQPRIVSSILISPWQDLSNKLKKKKSCKNSS